MTTVAYALGRPRPAGSRGGDCHVRDLASGNDWAGPHRFAEPQHMQIDNGLLRLTVGEAGEVPALAVEARRGRLAVEDLLSDILSDTLPGETGTPEWITVGTVTIDSPAVSAVLTGARIEWMNPESVTVRLVAPLIGNAFITLPRGWRSFRIDHGNGVPPFANIARRVRWTASLSPVGAAFPGRVEETVPEFDSFPRTVFSLDAVTANAGAFSLTTPAVTSARFGAGVGTYLTRDTPSWVHRQVGDASRSEIVFREDVLV